MQARSFTIDQHWSDMTQADREAWANKYADEGRRELGEFVLAAQKLTRWAKRTGAYELHEYDPDKHVDAILSAVARRFADEVNHELGIFE